MSQRSGLTTESWSYDLHYAANLQQVAHTVLKDFTPFKGPHGHPPDVYEC